MYGDWSEQDERREDAACSKAAHGYLLNTQTEHELDKAKALIATLQDALANTRAFYQNLEISMNSLRELRMRQHKMTHSDFVTDFSGIITATPLAALRQALAQPVNADEQAVFEDWLHRKCPSGDVTEVQRQWVASSEYADYLEQALAQPVPDVAAVMQERDDLRFQRDLSRELMREQAARIAELEQGQDALDAKRYQWLRARLPGSAYRIAGVIYSEGGSGVDMAIDAAMGTQPAPATAPACFMCHGTGEHAMPVAIPAGVKAPTPIIVKCRQCKGAQP